MSVYSFLFALVFGLYAISFVLYGLAVCVGRNIKWLQADVFFEIGFLLHTFFIFAEAHEAAVYLPITTFKEVLVFFAWSLGFVYMVLLRRVKHETFGLILLPFLLLFLGISFLVADGKGVPPDYLSSHFFLIHILSAFIAYASFSLSFIASVLYLIQSHALKSKQVGNFYHRLPPLKELERFIFHSVIWGVFLLGIAIVTGAFWSKSVFRTFIVREPKSIASMITCLIYGLIFFLKTRALVGERRSVLFVLFAFMLVLFTFLGTSLFQTKLHVGI